MTPKQKAKDIYSKFTRYEVNGDRYFCKGPIVKVQSLILVDAMIEFELKIIEDVKFLSNKLGSPFRCDGLFWEEVKQEIEKI
jgi:hypothetical protein